MTQPSTATQGLDEPFLSVRWADKGAGSQPDALPLRFFANEGFLPGQVHRVGSKPGRQAEAKCDVRVQGRSAELDYQPYPDFNRASGMLRGVTRLTFGDDARTQLLAAEWKPQHRTAFEPPVTVLRSPVTLAAATPPVRAYYRVMLGRGSVHAEACFAGGFIGTDFGIPEDLSGHLPETWQDFNRHYVPIYLATHPERSRTAAGLACGFLWTVSKGIKVGDLVLSPDGSGRYRVGEVTGDYYYAPDQILFHHRPVRWLDLYVDRSAMSLPLRRSAGSIGTVSNLTRSGHGEELSRLIGTTPAPVLVSTDASVEDPNAFALEKHLQEFLIHNWRHTELGRKYDIYHDDESDGEQVAADGGYIDILAVSKDQKELLVVELKRGRASDVVVGQIQRYMGYVLEELAGDGQKVRGAIIALEDDLRIRRALKVTQNIEFFRYEVSFRLFKA